MQEILKKNWQLLVSTWVVVSGLGEPRSQSLHDLIISVSTWVVV